METASWGVSWFLQQVERPRPYEEQVQLVEQCISDNEEGVLALLFVPKGLLLLIGILAAWPARRLCIPLCNNTRNCGLCLGIAAVMCIIAIPIIMHVRQYPNPFYGITGLIIMAVSAALLVIGVVPQVRSYLIEENGYETWQSPLLYVFVCYFRSWPCTKPEGWICVLIKLTNRSIAIM